MTNTFIMLEVKNFGFNYDYIVCGCDKIESVKRNNFIPNTDFKNFFV